jgi:predicted  nucleic acid-binding Zn-ribbon protein
MAPMFSEYKELDTLRKALVEDFIRLRDGQIELGDRISKLEEVNSDTGLSVADIVMKIDKLEENRVIVGGVTQQDFRDLEQSVEEFKESLQELSDEMSNFDFHDMEAGVMRIDDVVTAVTKIHDAIERAGTEVSGATRYL